MQKVYWKPTIYTKVIHQYSLSPNKAFLTNNSWKYGKFSYFSKLQLILFFSYKTHRGKPTNYTSPVLDYTK